MRLVALLNEGLARIDTGEFGVQLWSRGKARKAKKCRICDGPILVKAFTWMPLTNGYNRMHRLCQGCIEGLARVAAQTGAQQ